MKKKIFFIIAIVLSVILICILLIFDSKGNPKNNRININGIENFKPIKRQSEDTYLLFYPSDIRTSQQYTIVKEVNKDGDIICEYEIKDDDFRRAFIHQKPTDLEKLYLSLFGEQVIENWYYLYDINSQTFSKEDIPYFNFDVGVDHIKHYGDDVLFQTLVSYKTGDQVYNEETGDFKLSISNYTKQNNYETEWGRVPNGSPLLQLEENIFYACSGRVDENGLTSNAFVGVINGETHSVEYIDFNKEAKYFFTAYATADYAFILGDNGKLFVIDKNLNYDTFEPFNELPEQHKYYDNKASLMLNNNLALHGVYNYDSGVFKLGLLNLNGTPTFTLLEKDYLNENNSYQILYQDIKNNLIYLKEMNVENDEHYLVVLDNQTLNLIDKIPIEYSYLLDFVIKP